MNTYHLPNEAALDAMLKRTHCRVARPLNDRASRRPLDTDAPPSSCPYCKRWYGSYGALRMHVNQKHPGMSIAPKPKAVKPPKPRSEIEQLMSDQIRASGLTAPVEWPKYFKPIEGRNYKVDFYWHHKRFILEVDGMCHRIRGRFKSGFERDALLKIAGYDVLHVGGSDVREGRAILWLSELMGKK